MNISQNVVERLKKLVRDVNILQTKVLDANKNLPIMQEDYEQVKGDCERLQQNMLQLQMELEAVPAECQQERRLRADTVNNTHNLWDELERLVEKFKEKAAYDACLKTADKVIEKLQQDHIRIKEKWEQLIRELEGKMTQMTAQLSQVSAVFGEYQQCVDAAISELQGQLREAPVDEHEPAASTSKLGAVAELEQRHRELPSHSPNLQLHPESPGSSQDTLFGYSSEPSADSPGLQSQETRYFAFAARSEALPLAPSPTKKRMRPDTPTVREKSDCANVAAADSFLAPETSKPYRFFKSRGNTKKK